MPCKYHPSSPVQSVCKCGNEFCSECATPFVGMTKEGISYLCADCSADFARKRITRSFIAAGIGFVMGIDLIRQNGLVGFFASILYAYMFWGTYLGWHYGGRIWGRLGEKIGRKIEEAWWLGFIIFALRLTVAFFVGIFGGGISQFLSCRKMLERHKQLAGLEVRSA